MTVVAMEPEAWHKQLHTFSHKRKRKISGDPFPSASDVRFTFALPQGHFAGMCKFTIAFDQEEDGRFIAEVQEIPGALASPPTAITDSLGCPCR